MNGSVSGSSVSLSWRGRGPSSDVADQTVVETGALRSDGDSIYGTETATFDADARTISGTWNLVRRRLRPPPFSIDGVISSPGDRVHFAFWAPRGAIISAEVLADRLGSPLDAVLRLLGSDAETELAYDDDTIGTDPVITGFVAPQSPTDSQVYYLQISGFSNSTGLFRANVSISVPGPTAAPWRAPLIASPGTVSGAIATPGQANVYALDLIQGISMFAEIRAGRQGSPLDSVLALLGPDGITELAVNDDGPGLGQDSRLTYSPLDSGRYFLVVQGYDAGQGGPAYQYTLTTGRSTTQGLSADPILGVLPGLPAGVASPMLPP